MAEDERHDLIWALRDRLPLEGSGTVTHAVGTPSLPDPPLVAGHQPDLLGEGVGGTVIVGLAREGPDIDSDLSLEQYRAFADHRDPRTGDTASLIVVVRSEFKEKAKAAIEQAGVGEDRYFVLGVGFPDRG